MDLAPPIGHLHPGFWRLRIGPLLRHNHNLCEAMHIPSVVFTRIAGLLCPTPSPATFCQELIELDTPSTEYLFVSALETYTSIVLCSSLTFVLFTDRSLT